MTDQSTLILSLPSGEHIIADVTVDGGSFMCTNVLEIIRHVDDSGAMRMGLTPYMPYASVEGGISVPLTTAVIAIPGAELKNAHQRTFSKIITPESATGGIILPS